MLNGYFAKKKENIEEHPEEKHTDTHTKIRRREKETTHWNTQQFSTQEGRGPPSLKFIVR